MSPNGCYQPLRSVHASKGWGIARRAITVASRVSRVSCRTNRWDIAGFSGTMTLDRSDGCGEDTANATVTSARVVWEVMGT